MPRPAPVATGTYPRVSHVRSTLLLSSRTSITGLGLFDRYEKQLSPSTRSQLSEMIAGIWMPVELAVEHWAACDSLGLTASDQTEIGRKNGERLRGTLLGTLAKLARGAGTTPLTLIEQFPRFWSRIFMGGGMTYAMRGPKDATVTAFADPILRSAHFRNGLAGTASSILSLVCTRLFVRINAYDAEKASGVYLMQWA